jgi:chemotaxis protein MotB
MIMKKFLFAYTMAVGALVSCVPAKKLADLEEQHKELKLHTQELEAELADCDKSQDKLAEALEEEKSALAALKQEKRHLKDELEGKTQALNELQDSYDALESNSAANLEANSKRNRELLQELEEKRKRLNAEQQRLSVLEQKLSERSGRIDELEQLIGAKDAKLNALKTSLSKALTNFEGKGLSVEQKNGKVYVLMENKLLFASGSWTVGQQGIQAVNQLAQVLAENNDINVLIEGHTDNVPYSGNAVLKDNWDLSTKRATAIVHLLQRNKKIKPNRLTAAGRGEFAPVASNTSPEGRAKNRRIEVILAPNWDELNSLLSIEN